MGNCGQSGGGKEEPSQGAKKAALQGGEVGGAPQASQWLGKRCGGGSHWLGTSSERFTVFFPSLREISCGWLGGGELPFTGGMQAEAELTSIREAAEGAFALVRQVDLVTLEALPPLQSFQPPHLVKANQAGVQTGTRRCCWVGTEQVYFPTFYMTTSNFCKPSNFKQMCIPYPKQIHLRVTIPRKLSDMWTKEMFRNVHYSMS